MRLLAASTAATPQPAAVAAASSCSEYLAGPFENARESRVGIFNPSNNLTHVRASIGLAACCDGF
jgi:hypothetical protein